LADIPTDYKTNNESTHKKRFGKTPERAAFELPHYFAGEMREEFPFFCAAES
jgi:hypothetical protein